MEAVKFILLFLLLVLLLLTSPLFVTASVSTSTSSTKRSRKRKSTGKYLVFFVSVLFVYLFVCFVYFTTMFGANILARL